mgnify:CR=1 FL=1
MSEGLTLLGLNFAGLIAVILILWLVPEQHASFSDVFAKTINNSGMFGGSTSGWGWLLFVLPIAAILTQYTITGYDASAHLSEETKSAADAAAKGIWRSIFYSALGGWILLLSFLFAVQDPDGVSTGGGAVVTIFNQALPQNMVVLVLFISTAGQFFCTTACQTSASRTWPEEKCSSTNVPRPNGALTAERRRPRTSSPMLIVASTRSTFITRLPLGSIMSKSRSWMPSSAITLASMNSAHRPKPFAASLASGSTI